MGVDPSPMIEAAVALLQATPDGRLNTVNLNKALFYLDLVALRDLGETVSRCPFVALPQGPVVADYDRKLIRRMVREGLVDQVADGPAKPVTLKQNVEVHTLTPAQLALVPKIAEWAAKETSANVSDLSHKNVGWQLAYADGLQAGKPAATIDMLIAMQQIADVDPWLEEPLDDDTMALIATAASAHLAF
jgi:hypothetical protein